MESESRDFIWISHKMMLSGYSVKFWLETIQSAVRGYENQCKADDDGVKTLHRPREFQAEERRKNKLLSKTSWYRPASAVGFIPATPGAELAAEIQKIVTEETARVGLTAKIFETGGKSLKDLLWG